MPYGNANRGLQDASDLRGEAREEYPEFEEDCGDARGIKMSNRTDMDIAESLDRFLEELVKRFKLTQDTPFFPKNIFDKKQSEGRRFDGTLKRR
jgi:hypothetical protein